MSFKVSLTASELESGPLRKLTSHADGIRNAKVTNAVKPVLSTVSDAV